LLLLLVTSLNLFFVAVLLLLLLLLLLLSLLGGFGLLGGEELGVLHHVTAFLSLLELSLGGCLCVLIGELDEDAALCDEFEHPRQVLHVIEPPEQVRQLDLLVSSETPEVAGHVRVSQNVRRGYRRAHQEHARLQVGIQVL
jgi:hypothetical protein